MEAEADTVTPDPKLATFQIYSLLLGPLMPQMRPETMGRLQEDIGRMRPTLQLLGPKYLIRNGACRQPSSDITVHS